MNHDLHNTTELIEIWAGRFGTVRSDRYESTVNITIHHGISKNFSEYIAEMHRAMGDNLAFNISITDIDEMFIRMKIES